MISVPEVVWLLLTYLAGWLLGFVCGWEIRGQKEKQTDGRRD